MTAPVVIDLSVSTNEPYAEIRRDPTGGEELGALGPPLEHEGTTAFVEFVFEPDFGALADATFFLTGPSAPRSVVNVLSSPEGGAHEPDRVGAAASARAELLARKFVRGELSPEENARLQIAKERLHQLIPRVSAADFERLAEMGQELEQIQASIRARRQRLGIGSKKR